MLNTATITQLKGVGWRGRERKFKISPHTKGAVLLFFIFLISGVILVVNETSRPIFASELAFVSPSVNEIGNTFDVDIKAWETKINRKYGCKNVVFVTTGVAHIKTIKYINKKPVKINIIEVNPKINPNLTIKPQIAGSNLNKRSKISKIAQKDNAIVAINGGYFKPQTGAPLGSIMIDGNYITGPVYNRAGIGITQNENGMEFTIGKTDIKADVSNKKIKIDVDNINQPRMLSTYVLAYTPIWGNMAPIAPKNGANAVIDEGKVTLMSANPVTIPKNGFVISGPKEKIYSLSRQENLILNVQATENFAYVDHIIGGGPYLIKNGEIYIDYNDEKLQAITGANPRSAIGYNKEGEFIMVTVDGREKTSVGMTLTQLAKYMKSIGCQNAINLDGGGSSVLYVKGQIKNSPANSGGIPISNALVITEADTKLGAL